MTLVSFSDPTRVEFGHVQWNRPESRWWEAPPDAATEWARAGYDAWAASLSYEEFEAMQLYKFGWNEPSLYLRGVTVEGNNDASVIADRIRIMDAVLSRCALPQDVVMWRGMDKAYMQSFVVGEYRRYMGYMSFSSLREFAERWGVDDPSSAEVQPGMLELRFPRRYPMAYTEYFWTRGNQYEFLALRGVVWRVCRIIPRDEHGYFRVVGEVVPRQEADGLLTVEPWMRPRYTTDGLDVDQHFPLQL